MKRLYQEMRNQTQLTIFVTERYNSGTDEKPIDIRWKISLRDGLLQTLGNGTTVHAPTRRSTTKAMEV